MTPRPKRMTRAAIRRIVIDLADGLHCSGFFACPGPDAPTKAMGTCNECYTIKRLRVLAAWLGPLTNPRKGTHEPHPR